MAKSKLITDKGLAKRVRLIRDVLRVGGTLEELRPQQLERVRQTAQQQGWRASETAMALSAWEAAFKYCAEHPIASKRAEVK